MEMEKKLFVVSGYSSANEVECDQNAPTSIYNDLNKINRMHHPNRLLTLICF